jgi:hypothetical protein
LIKKIKRKELLLSMNSKASRRMQLLMKNSIKFDNLMVGFSFFSNFLRTTMKYKN